MSTSIGSTNITVGVDVAPAEGGFRRLTGELKLFAADVDRARPGGLRDTVAQLRHTASAAERARASVGGLADRLRGLGGGLLKGGVAGVAAGATLGLGAAGLGGVADLVGGSVDLAARAEANAMAFEVLTGSAERARAVLGQIREFARESPFGTEGVTKATRGLIAYGLASEKAVPTVRMLGQVAAASGDRAGETLDRLVLAYGQVFTAGRMQAEEMNQFTEAGVPIVEELAKVLGRPKAEVKALAAAGQVGFAQVAKAFHGMTAAGGRFAGMSERYADTFQGTVDRLKDGVEELKREFGVALVEELGLKDAARDGEKFAADMKALVGDLRPGIRFVGDVGRGLAQVLGEGVRNAPLFFSGLVESLRHANPQLGAFADRAVGLVKDLKDFKLDPRDVMRFAVDVGRGLGGAVHAVISSLGDGLTGVYNDNVKPIVEALKDAANTWKTVKGLAAAPGTFGQDVGWVLGQEWEKNFGKGKPTEEAFLADRRKDFASVDRVAQMALDRKLTLREAGTPGRMRDLVEQQQAVREARAAFERKRDELIVTEYRAKWNPSRENFDRVRAEVMPGLEKDLAARLRDLADATKKAGVEMVDVRVNGAPVGASLPEMAGPASREKAFWDGLEAKLMGLADRYSADRRPGGGTGGRFGWDLSKVGDAVSRMGAKALKAADSLQVLADDAPAAAAVKELLAPQLPPVAEYGTAEFARLAGQALYQREGSAEDLLRKLLAVGEEQRDLLRAGQAAPEPVPVRLR